MYVLSAIDNIADGPNGLPSIGSDGGHSLTIAGNGAVITRGSSAGTPSIRILHVDSGATVTVARVTLSGGRAEGATGSADGAVLFSAGTVTLGESVLAAFPECSVPCSCQNNSLCLRLHPPIFERGIRNVQA